MFETLPKLSSEEIVQVCKVLSGTNVIVPDPDLQEPFTQILTSPLTNDQLQALQTQDEKCTSLTAMLTRGKLDPLVYSMNDGVLHRRVVEGGQTFQAIYVPRTPPGLIESILKAAHDDSGHNGFPRTYSAISNITGKVSKKTYGNIAPIATLVNCTGLLQSNSKLSISSQE